jgi:hypothetical protein
MYIYPHEWTGWSSDCPLVNCTELVDPPLPQYLLQPPSLIQSTSSFVSSSSSSPSNFFSLAVSSPYLPPVVLSLPQTPEGTISRFLTNRAIDFFKSSTCVVLIERPQLVNPSNASATGSPLPHHSLSLCHSSLLSSSQAALRCTAQWMFLRPTDCPEGTIHAMGPDMDTLSTAGTEIRACVSTALFGAALKTIFPLRL